MDFRVGIALTSWLGVAVGCGGSGSPGAAEETGTGEPTGTDTDTETDTDTSGSGPSQCMGEGSMEPFGTSGHPDPGDGACGEHELCVIDECVPIPFEPVDECEPAVSPVVESVALPVVLSGLVAADLDDDGADEIWGVGAPNLTLRGFDREGTELGALGLDTDRVGVTGAARWDAAPDSLLVAVSLGNNTGFGLVHAWPTDTGLALAQSEPLADDYPYGLFVNDFDGDGSIEIVVDFHHNGIELWSLAPESAPVHVETLAGSYPAAVLPLPDGDGLGLAVPQGEELFYYAVTSEGLQQVATRSLAAGGSPRAFGAFRSASMIELFVTGAESFSEFDHVMGFGLGTLDETAVQVPSMYFFSLLDHLQQVLVADLAARPVVAIPRDESGLFVQFDADGIPCATQAQFGWDSIVGDFDGDGGIDLLSPTADGVQIFSADR